MHPTLTSQQVINSETSHWPHYDLYGLTLASDFSFANRLIRGTHFPRLSFTCVSTSPLQDHWQAAVPAYSSSAQLEDGRSLLLLYRQGDYDILRFTDVADFYLWPERIVCHLLDPIYDYWVEIALLGTVLSYWLEQQGILAFHASAVVVEGQAAAFLATNKGGKSSLAATLMQAGYPLLTDDILTISQQEGTSLGRPGYPQMRMWPDQAQHFLGHYQDLELVHPALSKRRIPVGSEGLGAFCNTPQPLGGFYLPQRRDSEEGGTAIEITPVSPRDAVIELVRHSFAANLLEPIGLQPQRLNHIFQLVQQVPMRCISYPSGGGYLPQVRQAILDDLASCN